MARGQKDYGLYAVEDYLAGMSDMAELAVRLGSIVIFDRRGKVITLDNCESPIIKWSQNLSGNGVVFLDDTYSKSGTQCLQLSATASGDAVTLARGFPPLLSRRIGLEFSFSRPSPNNYLDFKTTHSDGVNFSVGKIRVDINAKKLYYLDSSNAFIEFAEVGSFDSALYLYYPIKLVVDFETNKYVRLLFAGTEYDLSSYGLYVYAAVASPYVSFIVTWQWRTGIAGSVYLDDFIFTQDEP